MNYNTKTQHYFQNIRLDLLNLIPKDKTNGAMLEIGSGGGDTLVYAKQKGYANKVHGIELCDLENSNQHNKLIDSFHIGNIETMQINFPKAYFDIILFGDVLEHLLEPSKVLIKMKKFLKKDRIIIASIPNIRHYEILKKIYLQGDFQYEESGILDKTHLRFFCKKNMIELFEESGYTVNSTISNYFLHYDINITRYIKQVRLLKILLYLLGKLNIIEELFTYQYFLIVRKKAQDE